MAKTLSTRMTEIEERVAKAEADNAEIDYRLNDANVRVTDALAGR